MKRCIFLLKICVLVNLNVFCQNYDFGTKPYSNGSISLKNGVKFDALQIDIQADSISYNLVNSSFRNHYHMSRVDYVKLNIGHQGKRGAFLGGMAALSIVVYSVLDVGLDDKKVFNPNIVRNSIILVGAGTGIGLIIGMSKPRWKTIFPNL
ncbi:hypothetical protein [uncultured Arcticibacterium sp.]|uniref:hypothetical protein n=1 Tax=uncultured Arcticibacterium sp. TaxID=2173042 RepID=UPI0030FA1621